MRQRYRVTCKLCRASSVLKQREQNEKNAKTKTKTKGMKGNETKKQCYLQTLRRIFSVETKRIKWDKSKDKGNKGKWDKDTVWFANITAHL